MALLKAREPIPFTERVAKFDSKKFGSTLMDRVVIGVCVLFSAWAVSALVNTSIALNDAPTQNPVVVVEAGT